MEEDKIEEDKMYKTGTQWVKSDEHTLWNMVEDKNTTETISEFLCRSIGAIETRKKKIARTKIKTGDDIDDIRDITGLSLCELFPPKDKVCKRCNHNKKKRANRKTDFELTNFMNNMKL
jgi:hypothetical protein